MYLFQILIPIIALYEGILSLELNQQKIELATIVLLNLELFVFNIQVYIFRM